MAYSLFELRTEDIKELDDKQLVELIRRLCEADVLTAGESTKCVNYGGKSDETDWGLDIVITMKNDPPQSIYIPRQTTGVQVKKSDMKPSKIQKEMSTHIGIGKSINWLAEQSGAYIIVSSGRSCTQPLLMERKKMMRSSVSNIPESNKLDLDFFDLQKITSWVNIYPGIVAWVKSALGKPQNDWYPYRIWSNPGTSERYILDEKLRLFEYPNYTNQKDTVEAGINRIREKLFLPGSSIRLVGLSGVGKTRLVQALFESEVGERSLPQHWALYSENNHPDPLPEEMAQILKNERQRIVLIIDNCSREIHNKLTRCVKDSQISLLTIDYDIQDDLPSETDVFVLEPASKHMLVELLNRTNPSFDSTVIDKIASLSDGNSRIALALVQAFRKSKDFGTLLDEEVFERLFWQKKDKSGDLYETARACSLVYSFNSSDSRFAGSEIQLLANLAGQTYDKFHRNLDEIRRRSLLQNQGPWSALLPQALANRITSNALTSYSEKKIFEIFVDSQADRLQSSFCHRLSFLHNNQFAKNISNKLLSPQGELGRKGLQLTEGDRKKIYHLLSIDFDNSLKYFEKLVNLIKGTPIKDVSEENVNWMIRSLLVLACFPENFEKSLGLIESLQLIKGLPEKIEPDASKQLYSLFWPVVSGTEVLPDIKHKHISELLQSSDIQLNNLGVLYLKAAFQTENLIPFWPVEFGARPLTFGYSFKSSQEVKQWYQRLFSILSTAFKNRPFLKAELLSIIEDNFWPLLKSGFISDELFDFVKMVRSEQTWLAIWAEIVKIQKNDHIRNDKELREKIEDLEALTRPNSVVEEVRIYLRRPDIFVSLSRASQRSAYDEKMKEFGEKISKDMELLDEIGADFFVQANYGVNIIVESITRNSQDAILLWQKLLDNYRRTIQPSQSAIITFFRTLWEINPNLADSLEKEVLENPELSEIYLNIFILRPNIGSQSSKFRELLKSGDLSPDIVFNIGKLQIGNQITEQEFCELLDILSERRTGYHAAIQILEIKSCEFQNKSEQLPHLLLEKGRDLLLEANSPGLINWRDPIVDLSLSTMLASIPESYLSNDGIVKLLKELFSGELGEVFCWDYHPAINQELAKRYPSEFLDTIFERIGDIDPRSNIYLWNKLDTVGMIIQNVNSDEIITWMKVNLGTRAPFLSRYVRLVEEDRESGIMKWTKFGNVFLSLTTDIPTVLENIMVRMHPRSWFGNLSLLLRKYLPLFDDPSIGNEPDLRSWGNQAKAQWLRRIELEEREESRDQQIELPFE